MFSDGKCITILKKGDVIKPEMYIVYGKYSDTELPKDNYIKLSNWKVEIMSILAYKDDKIIIDCDDHLSAERVIKSSDSILDLYSSNKKFYDSLFNVKGNI